MATSGWANKLEWLTRGMEWATGVCGVWKFQMDAFQAPENNDPWFELRMRRIFETGQDEVCQVDNIDPVTGLPDATSPRAEVVVGQREFLCELRVFGRDQEHDVVAWVIAERARTRMRLPYFRQTFLSPPPADDIIQPEMSLITLFDVVPMPSPEQVVMDRWQSEAVLEMRLATVVRESDGAAVGTWIEKVALSSDKLLQPDGETPLDDSIQIDTLIDASSP